MFQLRVAVVAAIVCGASYGCATPADEAGAKAPAADTAAPQPRSSGAYRTGSRLPSYDSDGASSTGAMGKDDYMDDAARRVNPSMMR